MREDDFDEQFERIKSGLSQIATKEDIEEGLRLKRRAIVWYGIFVVALLFVVAFGPLLI